MATPKPDAVVALAPGEQSQAHRVVQQFKDKLRQGLVRDAKLFPVHAMTGLSLAQVQQQAMAQFAHRHGRFLSQIFQDGRWRRVAKQIKHVIDQRQRRLAVEKFDYGHGVIFAVGQNDVVGERKLLVSIFKVRRQRGDLSVKVQWFAVAFEAAGMAPARQPLQQFGVG